MVQYSRVYTHSIQYRKRNCKQILYLCHGVEIVEAEVLRLGFKEAVFISAAWHYVREVEAVSHANDSDDRGDRQRNEQGDNDCLQQHISLRSVQKN